jgi:hypothetical protein
MSENKIDDKKEVRAANERRIKELLNISNRYIRTQKHLEEFADIMEDDRLEHTVAIQKERQHRMENLKNIIAYGKHEQEDEVQNLKRNLKFTENYLDNHAHRMDEFTLEKTLEKQAHRKEQLDFLD